MPREAAVVAAIVAELKRRGAYVLNFHGSARRLGVPDLLACVSGKWVAIEVKQPGQKATARQRAEMDRIRRAGGVAFEADNVATVCEVLDALAA